MRPELQTIIPRVLIVDDNEDNVEILEDYLEDEFEVRSAYDGEEALQIVDAFEPALVLLDIMMPGIDGFEVCRRLRERADLADLKIIMLSAKIELADRLAGYQAGADDYLTKPFDEGELLAKLKVYLQLRRLEEVDRLQSALISVLGAKVAAHDDVLGAALKSVVDGDVDGLAAALAAPAEQLSSVMSKTLRLVALRSGAERMSLQDVELHDLVEEAIGQQAGAAKHKSVEFHVDVPRDVVARLDRKMLLHALSHLIESAVKATPFYTSISVGFQGGAEPSLWVTDQGASVPDNPQQLSDHLTEEADVDLAICREIARLHFGELRCDSSAEATTFVLQLGSSLVRQSPASDAA
ncbi:MAG: response regulator [Gammaproteobacteria bacterium]|nr:response regulator [Gammaproteobacteria bacterium]